RTNGFQDRLVMTTSISLHIKLNTISLRFSVSAKCILSSIIVCVNTKNNFLPIFFPAFSIVPIYQGKYALFES
ncbi:MAG: hypothetical protein Q4D16_25940, partial [Eubacteriales bacterium]|nr:hypothetical protein [Eubacteriales bacterium]